MAAGSATVFLQISVLMRLKATRRTKQKENYWRMKRRNFITTALAAGSLAGLSSTLLSSCAKKDAAGKSAKAKIKLGFIPLTDCASVVMAHELGLYKKHGVDVEVSREASWAT